MNKSVFKLHFDDQGHLVHPNEQAAILHSLFDSKRPITDLWVLAHGWNNDEKSADKTYTQWEHLMQEQIHSEIADPYYQPLFIGIYWPSMLRIDNIGSGLFYAAPKVAEPIKAVLHLDAGEFETGYEPILQSVDMIRLQEQSEAYKEQWEIVNQDISSLIAHRQEQKEYFMAACCAMFDPLSMQSHNRENFSTLYNLMLTSLPSYTQLEMFVQLLYRYKIDDPHCDPFEETNILNTPEDALVYLATETHAHISHTQNESFPSDNPLFKLFHAFTFWVMKARAAVVGQQGVAAFLSSLKEVQQHRHLHIHLLGHSFGAKLLSASVYALSDTPGLQLPLVDDLILLLGAFSQFSFSSQIPDRPNTHGRYAALLERHLVAHPIVAIYSCHDLANKNSYPLGMRLTHRAATYEIGGVNDRFGSIGANGFQGLETTMCHTVDLHLPYKSPAGQRFGQFSCLNVDGQHVINQYDDMLFIGAHGDIYRPEIFRLALAVSLSQ